MRLEDWLIEKDMSGMDLKRKTGLSINTIINAKNCKTKKPSTKTRGRIAKGLGVEENQINWEV